MKSLMTVAAALALSASALAQNQQNQNTAPSAPPAQGASAAAPRPGQWAKTHPGRVEVNRRLAAQNRRINQGLKNGTINRAQARRLRRRDRRIRAQERRMARRDGNKGHLTRGQIRRLNREENRNSRRIFRAKH
jgi:hypothetical protein